MFLNYLLPEFKLLAIDRKNELLEVARISTAKRSTLFNLLFPICLLLSFILIVIAPLVFMGAGLFGDDGIWFYFLVTGIVSYACGLTSYHFLRALILAPELRTLIEKQDGHDQAR